MVREIVFYRHYFLSFYNTLDSSEQEKIDYVFEFIRIVERVPVKFLKHLEGTDGLYEIRVMARSNIFRIFCFFDAGKIVVILNGFQKKSNKTPKQEILKAEKIRKEYYLDKSKGKV